MTRRRKPGPKPTGLTIKKNFMVTPKTARELAKMARDYPSEGHLIRLALDSFFLTKNVRVSDNDVQSDGQAAELAAA